MYYAQHSPGVAHKLPDHQPWPRQAPSSQQPPGYGLFTHPHQLPLAHHHHHQNSLTSLNHYPSPPQMGSPAGQIMSQHWQQQLLKCEMVRASRSPHHRARASAMASRSVTKAAIPITNPNKIDEPAIEANHPSSTVSPIAVAPRITAVTRPENNWNSLDMGGVNIKSIPPTSGLFSFTFLTTLYLNHNALELVPPQIADLRHLELLDLSGNNLSHLPPELGMLTSLKELYLFDNHVSVIPHELGTLHQLQTIGVEGNPLDPYQKNIVQKEGSHALISYLRDNGPPPPPPPDRQWKTMEPPGTVGGEMFSVLCYNILCERCATERLYGYTPSWALSWEYRKEFILKEIVNQSADFICLQEVDVGQYEDFFTKRLADYNYEGVFWPKSRAKNMSESDRRLVDGCATFYNASRFKLVEKYLIEFSAVAMQRADFKKTDDMFNRVLGKDHIAVICLLEDMQTGTRHIIANAHIHWDPAYRDVKLIQVALLIDEIEQISKDFATYPPPPGTTAKYADGTTKIPLIICIDANSVPESGVYEFFRDGYLSPKHEDFMGHAYGKYTDEGLKHRLNLKSAYCGPSGEILPLTNFTPSFRGVIDYMWYSASSVSVSAVLGEQDPEYMQKVVGLPNAHYPSDHICISGKFRIKPPLKSIPPTP